MIVEPQPIDDGFDALMGKVERERGFSCARYKQKCLRRRVAVRMRALSLASFAEYSHLLDHDAGEFDRLIGTLTISVTRFFRDTPVWRAVSTEVVPVLWESDRPDITIWSAGCASGEEPLSMAMLFHRHAAKLGMLAQIDRVKILGTDVDKRALLAAGRAEYSLSDVVDAPSELRERYFSPGPPFIPPAAIRRMVRFAEQDLLGPDFFPGIQDVIICRNVLIYFDRPTQERVLDQFSRVLAPGGYLILGKVETLLGASRAGFAAVAQRERIFRKVSRQE